MLSQKRSHREEENNLGIVSRSEVAITDQLQVSEPVSPEMRLLIQVEDGDKDILQQPSGLILNEFGVEGVPSSREDRTIYFGSNETASDVVLKPQKSAKASPFGDRHFAISFD